MIDKIKKHRKNLSFFFMGALLVFGLEFAATLYKKTPLKKGTSSQKLSIVENNIREAAKSFKDSGVKTHIQRGPKALTLRLWEDNLFPISHWEPYQESSKIFSELAEAIKTSSQDVKVKIISHYDSVNPFGKEQDEKSIVLFTKKRALIIEELFLKEGLEKENLSIVPKGDLNPLVKDRDSYGTYLANEGRLNRRVEFLIEFSEEGKL